MQIFLKHLRFRTRQKGPTIFTCSVFWRLHAFLLLLSLIAGCTSFYLLTEEERSTITSGNKALVLLRVTCTIDNQPYVMFPSSLPMDDVTFGLGSFESLGEPVFVFNRYFSEESRRMGWTYFLLSPGVYYLTIRPPQQSDWGTYQKMLKTGPRWRIDVPGKVQLLYVGTLSLTGQAESLLFGGQRLTFIDDNTIAIENDEVIASKLLSDHFQNGDEMKTSLMRRWKTGEPIIIRSTPPFLHD